MEKIAPLPLVKSLVAELVGTFFLALTLGVSIVGVTGQYADYQTLYVPLAIGAVVAVSVYLLGPVSGGHFNPAVSLALFAVRKLSAVKLVGYVLVQLAGAVLAFQITKALVGVVPELPMAVNSTGILAEALGAFLLAFAVTRVVQGKVPEAMGGAVIGLALMVGITVSLAASGGVLNPALALALGSHTVTYLLAPLVGGVVAAGLAVWLESK